MKISGLVEEIFSQAVALSQDGGFRNTIYAIGKEIFVLNYDHTLLLRFQLRETETPFAQPIGFNANDYDSEEFQEENGKIIFTTTKGDFQRKKTCGVPGISPEEVRKLYRRYVIRSEGEKVELNRKVLELLDRDLSHVEFLGEKGDTLKMIQRNIYDGTIIEIRKGSGGLMKSFLNENFGPIAIKTNDFAALYNFQDSLNFVFPTGENSDYIVAFSMDKNRRDMTAIIAACLYDEIIEIREAKTAREG